MKTAEKVANNLQEKLDYFFNARKEKVNFIKKTTDIMTEILDEFYSGSAIFFAIDKERFYFIAPKNPKSDYIIISSLPIKALENIFFFATRKEETQFQLFT